MTTFYKVIAKCDTLNVPVGKIIKSNKTTLTGEDSKVKVYSLNGQEVTKKYIKTLVKENVLQRVKKKQLIKDFLESL